MTPDARIKANLEIMEKCAASSRIPMDGVVGDYMRHRRLRNCTSSRTLKLVA